MTPCVSNSTTGDLSTSISRSRGRVESLALNRTVPKRRARCTRRNLHQSQERGQACRARFSADDLPCTPPAPSGARFCTFVLVKHDDDDDDMYVPGRHEAGSTQSHLLDSSTRQHTSAYVSIRRGIYSRNSVKNPTKGISIEPLYRFH